MSESRNNPKVFISYSHDSQEHMDRVLALSDRLCVDGIDCIIDQYETSPPEGWAQWMIKQVKKADFVLIVCTKKYQLRFEGEEEPEKGKGAIWEGAIITQELYDSQGKNKKFIPVIFTPEDETHIPVILRSATYYNQDTEKGYKSLYRHLTKQPFIEKPVLGKLKSLPLRPRKQDFHAPPWNVPFQRNFYFTGREDVLEKLHKALISDKAAALAQAISGLGGIGKTQTAVEYAYRYRNEYDAVLWVKADSREALISDYAALAQVLDLPEKDAKEQNLIAAAVRRWLDNNSGWLLVFDNADEPGLLEDYIPIDHKCHVLLTSREQHFDNLGISKPVELEKMPPDEAKEFLLRRTGRNQPTQAENEAILKIAEKLGYLPLALEQAGAYINKVKCSFDDYLSSYQGRGLKLLQLSPPVAGKYPESVATTWLLNFEQVEKISKASADLLRVSAFLNPDNIPLELITNGARELGDVISTALTDIETDPLILDELLLPLTQYSLITRNVSERTYSIHRLVQSVIRDRMDDNVQYLWAERTVRAVSSAFPSLEFQNWHLCDRMLPQAQVSAELIEEWGFEFQEAALLLNQTGLYLFNQARYGEAEPMYRSALEIREKSLAKDHPYVAISLNNLAELYRVQSKYVEAEPMYRRALEILEKLLGKDHLDVATSLNNLALLYKTQGKYVEAEPMYRREVSIYEKSLGKDHPDVAASLNNLAGLYFVQGKYAEAEQMYRRALTIREKSLVKDHPDVATSLNNLAGLYYAQGKYADAEPMYKRALAILENSLVKDHPNVATSINNLAELYRVQGKYADAEPMYKRAFEIIEKSLGKDNPDVVQSLNNLAILYQSQGKYANAEPLYRRTLEILEKSLGSDHPHIATSLNNLATLYDLQGKYAEAEPMYKRALEIWEISLGKNHPNIASVLKNLAALLRKTNRDAEAREMEERARGIRKGGKGK